MHAASVAHSMDHADEILIDVYKSRAGSNRAYSTANKRVLTSHESIEFPTVADDESTGTEIFKHKSITRA